MNPDQKTLLWKSLDARRGAAILSLDTILQTAHDEKIPIAVEDLHEIAQRLPVQASETLCPPILTHFISTLVSGRSVDTILDPWAGFGSLIVPIAGKFKDSQAYAITPTASHAELAQMLSDGDQVTWKVGDPLTVIDETPKPIDLVVSCPPFNLPPAELKQSTHEAKVSVRDSKGNVVLIKACLNLADDGLALFVVPPSFFSRSSKNSVFRALQDCGLRLDACFALPPGTFAPLTSIASYLLVVSKGDTSRMFVGEMSQDTNRNKGLIGNFKSDRESKEIAMGRFTAPNSFQGYYQLVAEDRVKRLSERLGLSATPLKGIVESVNLVKTGGSFEDLPNAVYLPLIGRSNALSTLSEATLKHQNYAQLPLRKGALVSPQYLAHFFNTPLGLSVREGLERGTTIPKLSKTSIETAVVFLPEQNLQTKVIDANHRIESLLAELRELQASLWANPANATEVDHSIGKLSREERFQDWLDTLPFPLASILWAYHASKGKGHKQRHYLGHFFEALAEFMATVQLSAYRSRNDIFDEERVKLSEILGTHNLSLERSTFGVWIRIFERLAKRTNDLLGGKQEETLSCKKMFGTSDNDVISSLSNPAIVQVLVEANSIRNDAAHGGAVSEREEQTQLRSLEDLLLKVRRVFGSIWTRYELIIPGSLNFTDAGYTAAPQRLMGSRTPFETTTITSSTPLKSDQLYFFSQDDSTGLELLPLVRIMESPTTAQNACYFYSRREDDGMKYVSYHFETEASVVRPSDDTASILAMFDLRGDAHAG